MAFFAAFYSYKGGVGRTLALANVGYSLAARGKRVVLLDMDLEAPGLLDFSELALKTEAKKGFLDYAAAYRKTGECPSIQRYVHPCRNSPGTGKLWLMPAGHLGPEYQDHLGSLPWRRLHPERGTEPFVDGLRRALIEEIDPHYVLVDARTGLSDIGGLSTHLLADMVVLVFNLTRACIEGSVRTYRSFTAEGSRVRFLQLVASPIPPGGGPQVESRLIQAAELMPLSTAFGRKVIRLDYQPGMVLADELAVRHPERFQAAAASYQALREAVQRASPDEVLPILEQARELRSAGRLEDALDLLRLFTEGHPADPDGYMALGDFLFEAGRAGEASPAFRTACDLRPDASLPQRRLGEALTVAEQAGEALEALGKARKLGDRSRELFTALAQAHALLKNNEQETDARRQAMLAILGESRNVLRSSESSEALRKEFIEVLNRRPPFPEFRAEEFWNNVMASVALSYKDKLAILRHTLDGTLNPSEIMGFLLLRRDEEASWFDWGPETELELEPLKAKIAEFIGQDHLPPETQIASLLAFLNLDNRKSSSHLLRSVDTWLARNWIRKRSSERSSALNDLFDSLGVASDKAARSRIFAEAMHAGRMLPDWKDYDRVCALSRLRRFEEAAELLRSVLESGRELPPQALEEPDLQGLWKAHPGLAAEAARSLGKTASTPT